MATVRTERQVLAEQEILRAAERPAARRRSDDRPAEIKGPSIDQEPVSGEGHHLTRQPDDPLEQERWPA
jgi:hypothetical protein